MKVTVVHPKELGEPELAAWRRFQQLTPALANPFLSPEFTVTVGSLQPRARVAVLTDRDEIVGFFPFERRNLGYGVPICAGHNDCQGLVTEPGLEWDPQQLLRACDLAAWEFTHLVDGQQPLTAYQRGHVASPVMDLSAGFDSFQQHLRRRKNKFRELTRTRRKLGEDVGDVRFEFDTRDCHALRTVMAWKSEQYLRSGWADRFASPFMVELLGRLLDVHTDTFAGVLSMLYAGDEPVAGHFGLRTDRVLALWFPAYAKHFRSYGPGLILNHDLAEAACAAGVQEVDMGPGDESYKQWFGSREHVLSHGRVVRRSPGGGLHWARKTSAERLHDVVLQNPSLHRVARGVRVRYIRAGSVLRQHSTIGGA